MRLKSFLVGLLAILANGIFSQDSATAANPIINQGDFVNYVDSESNGSAGYTSPEQQLKKCIQLAQSGEIEQAFHDVRALKNLQPGNHLFSVEYINTLLKIFDEAEEKGRIPILNEAIGSVNKLKSLSSFDGKNNPETAYHFMVVIGALADKTIACSQPVAAKLKLCQASIARNLKNNPAYPANAVESLADSLISAAQAYAIAGEQQLALTALTEAYQMGYCQFEELTSDASLMKLKDQMAFKAHVKKLQQAYLVKVKVWAQKEIDNFQQFGFEFNIDEVNGKSLSKGSYEKKVLVIDFWATWCAPCRKGIPHFVRLQDEFEGSEVQVLGISMDSPEDPFSSTETVKKFMSENGFNYPCGLGTKELTRRIPGEVKLPTTLFVDRTGNVRFIANGYHDYAKLAAITEILANETEPVGTH